MTFYKLSLIFFLVLIICSCGGIKNLPYAATDAIEMSSSGIAEGVVDGLSKGLNSEVTEINIMEALEKIVGELNYELSKVDLGQLDVQVVGDNLVVSVSESLERESNNIGQSVSTALNNVYTDGFFDNLSSEYNKERLGELFGSIFSSESGNGEALGEMLNTAISSIDLSPLGDEIKIHIDINEMLEPTVSALGITGESIGSLAAVVSRGQDKWRYDLLDIWIAIITGSIIIAFGKGGVKMWLRQWRKFRGKDEMVSISELATKMSDEDLRALAKLLNRI